MRRLVLAALAAATLVVPAPSADAAPTTCHGLPVTLTGSHGAHMVGTEGDDVIVTDDASSLDALGGNDTICVTGDFIVEVDAGAGNDFVDTTNFGRQEPKSIAEVVLGPGQDYFVGAGAQDEVWAGPPDDTYTGPEDPSDGVPDTEADTINTGFGADNVVSGSPDTPNGDDLFLAQGRDTVAYAGIPSGGSIDGGDGADQVIWYGDQGHDWVIDDAGNKVSAGTSSAVLAHVERHAVGGLGWTSLTFFGGHADEDVDLQPASDAPAQGPVKVQLGAGDDRVQVDPGTRAGLDGGAGNDELKIFGSTRSVKFTGSVTVDLTAQRYHLGGGPVLPVTGFESATTWWFHNALLVGNAASNSLTALGCRVTLRGRGGDDTMRQEWRDLCKGRPYWAHEDGGPGNDRMYGGPWNDVLLGGPGHDTAFGGDGKDRCVAERRAAC